ncbi:CHAT domain-containing protein [Bradyrhizobium huanghuaihaiense]|uniref:CHAT domain-containing protein n=1 Tax=Bradyrhizobium huanghuaihaiense TaxID=990078 RepID=UPI0021AA2983|nr:CHAT domain-containing protein [Bradyrhizobium sp. CB3035]UWU76217.1 CHAT domain-containing protein [Bradyrhizobium sp. CB3035]
MGLGEIIEKTAGPIYSTCFSPSGELVAWGARNGELKIKSLRARSTQLNETYGDSIYAIAFSDDSASLLVALKTQARLINVASGESGAIYEHPEIETAVFSPDQELVYTAGNRGLLRLWNRRGGLMVEVTLSQERLLDLCFIDSGDTLVVSGTGGDVYFLSARTLSFKYKSSFPKSIIYKCRSDKSGSLLALSLHLQTGLWLPARLIPILVPDKYEIAVLKTDHHLAEPPLDRTMVGHTAWIGAICFSPTSSLLASGASDSRICLWDPETDACRANIGEHDGTVHDLAFSPTGELLISASADGTVRLWTTSSLLGVTHVNRALDINTAMLEAARRTSPGARINAGAQIMVDYLLSGPSERLDECAGWFNRNLPSQHSRIELVSNVTHLLQVRIEQAFREADEPRGGYLNWVRLELCARLGPVSPNGTYCGREFPNRTQSAALAATWLRSRLDLPETASQRPDMYATLATIYRDRLEAGDREFYRNAVSSLESAVALIDPAKDSRKAAILYRDLGDIHFEQNAWASAHAAYDRAIDLVGELINITFALKDLHLLIDDFFHVFSNDAYALVRLERYTDAILRLDQGKTRFINPISGVTALATSALDDEKRQEIRRACTLILRREEEMNATDGDRLSDDVLREELRLAHVHLAGLVETARAESGVEEPTVLSWESVVDLVPEKGAIVVTLTTAKGGGAFVIPHQQNTLTKEHFVELPGLTLDKVRRILHGARGAEPGWMDRFEEVTQQDWQEKIERTGAIIWDMFIEKIYECINSLGICERAPLIIVPSSGLGLLPWKAACKDEGWKRRYPLDSHVISFCPSINLLRACRARSKESSRSKGNPRTVLTSPLTSSFVSDEEYQISYDTGTAETVSPDPSILAVLDPSGDLEYARAEGEIILALFGPNERMALTHHLAWMSVLERWVAGYNYLHFACHAVYEPFDPMASYLQLEKDQRLTFGQIIASLDLYAARLVVLSACESGLTLSRSPDEYLGLSSAFLLAGAPAIASTLWPVDDASTMLLMQQFYHLHLQEKLSPAEALASAQEWLRTQTNEDLAKLCGQYSTSPSEALAAASQAALSDHVNSVPELAPYKDPYYWAGFTLVGV